MTFRRDSFTAPWRGVCLTLALLALVMKVAVPAGFMVARKTNDLPFALVICTAQGATVIQPGEALAGHDDGSKTSSTSPSDLCVFAGAGAATLAPAEITALSVAYADWRIEAPILPADLAPGRGLAAPPPTPARGPPSVNV